MGRGTVRLELGEEFHISMCEECSAGPCVLTARDIPDFCPFCSFDEEDRSLWSFVEE